jgi:hypothetical protein
MVKMNRKDYTKLQLETRIMDIEYDIRKLQQQLKVYKNELSKLEGDGVKWKQIMKY